MLTPREKNSSTGGSKQDPTLKLVQIIGKAIIRFKKNVPETGTYILKRE